MTTRLLVEHPAGYEPERAWILDVVLGEFLGLAFDAVQADRRDVRITLAGDPQDHQLIVADALFQTPEIQWLTERSLPGLPGIDEFDADIVLPWSRLAAPVVPVIYRDPALDDVVGDGSITLSLDIFGSAFFMLSRYEEVVTRARDQHQRFTSDNAFSGLAGVLDRPIINEYLEILWSALSRLWPALERKQRRHRVWLSHDVDWPLGTAGRPLTRAARTIAGDVISRGSPGLALRRGISHLRTLRGNTDADLNNTFDFIMNLNERHGFATAFYFISEQSAGEIDGVYSLDDPWIRNLMTHIHERGHEIGLHPSYRTFDNPARTRREFGRLRKVASELGIEQPRWGGRQHFLRWEAPTTWQNWEDAGLDYDSTLGFSDRAGFRCGVCYDFPVFNLHTRERLNLREHPLIAMEVTLTGYMGLSWEAAADAIVDLNETCRRYDGEFTLLWHNNNLVTGEEKRTYAAVLERLAG